MNTHILLEIVQSEEWTVMRESRPHRDCLGRYEDWNEQVL